ncbi:hypothetical protein CRG98_024838 [Punica granatum]|uniref:CRM domain-containing protein n=1 Tax=Punica granatum TaxID=22663 RepID=A0A2I0JGJ4_PUNGR|nr:hypothetical protein CRG98_024838 [Punica granatum]
MSMATTISPSCHLLRLHHLRRPHPPPRPPPLSSSTLLSLFFKPLLATPPPATAAAAAFSSATAATVLSSSPKLTPPTPASKSLFITGPPASLTVRPLPLLRQSISSAAFPQTSSSHREASHDGEENDDEIRDIDDDDEEEESYDEEEEEEEEEELGEGIVAVAEEVREPEPEPKGSESIRPVNGKKGPGLSLNLSVKEKKELASYAHSLGKKLKCQLVGKSGVTENVAASFVETLEANELLKSTAFGVIVIILIEYCELYRYLSAFLMDLYKVADLYRVAIKDGTESRGESTGFGVIVIILIGSCELYRYRSAFLMDLYKIKIHRTCPGELDEVVDKLQAVTGSVVVGQIGRTVIIYRPSLTKLEAEEKKKQAQSVFMRKRMKPRPALVLLLNADGGTLSFDMQKNGQASRMTARARRGSSKA